MTKKTQQQRQSTTSTTSANFQQQLLRDLGTTPISALSAVEKRILEIAGSIFGRHIGPAAVGLGYRVDIENPSNNSDLFARADVLNKAWEMSLRAAARIDEQLRQLRS
jgi:hypothetical protein